MPEISEKPKKLSKQELNKKFLEGLGDVVAWSSEDEGAAPLLIDISTPNGAELRLRVYLYNLTNPPGGRAADEYKAQIILPGQKKKEKGNLDYSDGRLPLLAAYAQDDGDGVFVLWDATRHDQISFSSNIQVKSDAILMATYKKLVCSKRTNNETIVSVRPMYLYEGIKRRLEIMKEQVLEAIKNASE